jgi:hypothetical protein
MEPEARDAPDFVRPCYGAMETKMSKPKRRKKWDPCPLCGMVRTREGYDACLGELPGVSNACCGHGEGTGYVQFTNGVVLHGFFGHTAKLGNPAMKGAMPDYFEQARLFAEDTVYRERLQRELWKLSTEDMEHALASLAQGEP